MLQDGSIIFLTDATAASLTVLPDLHSLAASVGRPLLIVHVIGGSSQRLAAALAALPGDPPGVLAVPAGDLSAALGQLTGVLALAPTRPGPLLRVLSGSQHEQLLGHGALPLLALPPGGRLPPITRVLFPADLAPRSNAPFDEALALCRALNAELHLLHVYGDDRLLPSEQDLARRRAAKSPRELMAIDQEQLRALADRAAAQGVPAHVNIGEGRAHAQILTYAAANAINLIVMAAHGPRSVEDILLGSTTARVIQRAQVAVLAMRA